MRAMDLKSENRTSPMGLDEKNPRLSWRLDDPRCGARQTAYRLVVASTLEKLTGKPDLWDTGRVNGDRTLDVVYAGKALKSRQDVWWRVQAWDHEGLAGEWSDPAHFVMGYLKPSDWKAQWIGRPLDSREESQPCPFLRHEFQLPADAVRARVHVTARGLFELRLDGRRVGEDYFTPGWTDYSKRVQYLVYDVTSDLKAGLHALGVILGDGWYAGHLGFKGERFQYGDTLSLLLQLDVDLADGTSRTILSGPDWRTILGPIRSSDIYHGEHYDARLEMPGWDRPEYDDSVWQPVTVFPASRAALVAKVNEPVRRQEELATREQTEPVFGVHVFDLGQNMVGWARIKIRGRPGQKVTMRYAEMLNADGTVYTANLRGAKGTDSYICRSEGEEVFEPHFTFHGFRYVELTGLREKPVPEDVTGIVLHSGMPATGAFECSDPLVNRLQQNIVWGQKGNFLEVPTDCPQRDERLGWTGDAQVFIRTACFNRDVESFFEKWCADVADSQLSSGSFPHVVPDVLGGQGDCAAWADAGVICPWTVYLCYGDTRILERQYDSMRRFVEWRCKTSRGYIHDRACFGDWLSIDIAENDPGRTPTPRDLIATAYFAHTAGILSRVAAILGRKADARKYREIQRKVKAAFNREFVSPSGRVVGDTQTGYLLALGFDLLSKRHQAHALERLVADIEGRGWKLSTGFVGTPLLAPVLTRFGRMDVAYRLLMQQEYPSWLYTVLQGGTTMWERWNSYTKHGGFGDVNMNSFNHYAYGAIGEWMYNTVAGIDLDPAEPGYKHILIHPRPGGGLTWVRGELMTRQGVVTSRWALVDGMMEVQVTIPPNTRATVVLPGRKPVKVAAGRYEYRVKLGR